MALAPGLFVLDFMMVTLDFVCSALVGFHPASSVKPIKNKKIQLGGR
jgi:hypothetical protein